MLCKVLKHFDYATDKLGLDIRRATPGIDADIPDDAVPGLVKEGYIAEVKAAFVPENKAIASPEVKSVVGGIGRPKLSLNNK
jgi:hypothetical protein